MDVIRRKGSTQIAGSTAATITVGGRNLVEELIGRMSFTEMLYFLTCGKNASVAQRDLLDACLVTLMEHGLNPSTLIARLAAHSVPEEPQVAMAAGLLAIGSVYAGSTEDCARLLLELETAAALSNVGNAARRIAERYRQEDRIVPGFGHRTHKPDDPRSPKLLALAQASGLELRYVPLLEALGVAVDAVASRHVTLNATGAIAALLLDIGIPVPAMRGYSVVARAGGLVGHLLEEQRGGSALEIWQAAQDALPYRDPE